MSGRVVFALTESQADALIVFSMRGGHELVAPQNVPGDLRSRSRVFAALVSRGYIGRCQDARTGWRLTPAGHEVAAVARRLASLAGTFPAVIRRPQQCAA